MCRIMRSYTHCFVQNCPTFFEMFRKKNHFFDQPPYGPKMAESPVTPILLAVMCAACPPGFFRWLEGPQWCRYFLQFLTGFERFWKKNIEPETTTAPPPPKSLGPFPKKLKFSTRLGFRRPYNQLHSDRQLTTLFVFLLSLGFIPKGG